MADTGTTILLGAKTYDRIKFICTIVLPASITLYVTLGAIWSFPNVEQVVGTLGAIATFLGALIGLSSASYKRSDAKYDGKLLTSVDDDGKITHTLDIDTDLDKIPDMNELNLKVVPRS